MQMILIILIRKEDCSENVHFLNNQILKKYSSFYVLLFDSGPEQYIIDTLTYYSFYTKILELGNFATEQILLC